MAIEIQFANDVTNADERARGSDGRLNVSSRSDARSYYNSRDQRSAYTLTWHDASTATNDFILYWKNIATDGRHLIISRVDVHSQFRADFILWTGNNEVASGGTSTTPFNLNVANPLVAPATARTADSSTIATVTNNLEIATVSVEAGGHGQFSFENMLRLGQDQSILLECQLTDTSPGLTWGTAYGFYE